eukprot:5117379-Prymnesium_polylepis.1
MGMAPLQMEPGKRCTGLAKCPSMPGYLPYDPLLPTARVGAAMPVAVCVNAFTQTHRHTHTSCFTYMGGGGD